MLQDRSVASQQKYRLHLRLLAPLARWLMRLQPAGGSGQRQWGSFAMMRRASCSGAAQFAGVAATSACRASNKTPRGGLLP